MTTSCSPRPPAPPPAPLFAGQAAGGRLSATKGADCQQGRQHLFPKVGTIVVVADATLTRLGAIAERRWGLVTTAQAEAAGVARKQLSRMASTGAIERVAQGDRKSVV